jgi:hypothetical protein
MDSAKELDTNLTVKDLMILMEAYRNNIELSTSLLEQQKQILVQQDDILNKQKEIITSISNVSTSLLQLPTQFLSLENKFRENSSSTQLEMTKNYSSMRNLLYVVFIGSGSIIITLITIIVEMSSKMSVIEAIARKLGVG